MSRFSRRQASIICTSCLIALLTVPADVAAAVTLPDSLGRTAEGPEQPTPPPPSETDEPGTEQPDTGTPETQEPETRTPDDEGSGTQTPEDTPSQNNTQTSKPSQNLAPEEKQEEVADRIDGLNVPESTKKKLKQTLDRTMKAINDPKVSAADKALYEQVLDGMNKTLILIQDPKTPPRERRALTKGLEALDVTLKIAQDPKAPPGERQYYKDLSLALATIGDQLRDETLPEDLRRNFLRNLEIVSRGLLATQGQTGEPKNAQDRETVEQGMRETGEALITLQDPDASNEDRQQAQEHLDEVAASTKDPKYVEFLDQVKRYKASEACLRTIEDRTNSIGWPDGSLWGLSDVSCDEPRATGVSDTSSPWNDLFICVDENPFSECAAYIPKD
ncbi:hypothetical protein [Streptomyces werraensis]|uniref:hypothetical protein n=1 Tax=Streptomyces werraensis TaxID=68284 RepID=UPI003430F2E1